MTKRVALFGVIPAREMDSPGSGEREETGEERRTSWLCIDTSTIEHLPVLTACKKILLSLTCPVDDLNSGCGNSDRDHPAGEKEESDLGNGERTCQRGTTSLTGSGVDTNGY